MLPFVLVTQFALMTLTNIQDKFLRGKKKLRKSSGKLRRPRGEAPRERTGGMGQMGAMEEDVLKVLPDWEKSALGL